MSVRAFLSSANHAKRLKALPGPESRSARARAAALPAQPVRTNSVGSSTQPRRTVLRHEPEFQAETTVSTFQEADTTDGTQAQELRS